MAVPKKSEKSIATMFSLATSLATVPELSNLLVPGANGIVATLACQESNNSLASAAAWSVPASNPVTPKNIWECFKVIGMPSSTSVIKEEFDFKKPTFDKILWYFEQESEFQYTFALPAAIKLAWVNIGKSQAEYNCLEALNVDLNSRFETTWSELKVIEDRIHNVAY